jgi:hypothetical protein
MIPLEAFKTKKDGDELMMLSCQCLLDAGGEIFCPNFVELCDVFSGLLAAAFDGAEDLTFEFEPPSVGDRLECIG